MCVTKPGTQKITEITNRLKQFGPATGGDVLLWFAVYEKKKKDKWDKQQKEWLGMTSSEGRSS